MMDSNNTIESFVKIQGDVKIGKRTVIRSFSILCKGVKIGSDCVIGPFVLIQPRVVIGDRCKIHSHSFICEGVTIGNEVFIAHGVMFTNEKYPKAVRDIPWELMEHTVVEDGAVVGSGAVILPGVRIGKGAMVGAGAIVVDNVGDGETVVSPKAKRINTD